MRKHESETTEYIPTSEDSTYQTGSAKPHAEHRGVIAVLMILVTFLGGIASALGIVNIRLLQELNQEERSKDHVALYVDDHQSLPSATDAQDLAPSLPSRSFWELPLEDAQMENPPEQVRTEDILQENRSSVVSISGGKGDAIASGVIVSTEGYILTNAYPLFCDDPIYVTLSDGQRYRATLVGIDEFTDLAVLYIAAENLTAASFSGSDCLSAGDFAACITADGKIYQGKLLDKAEYVIGSQIVSMLQTDLQATGPVYNACGNIVGFTSPALTGDHGTITIPSCIVKEVVEQIIALGFMDGRPCLGVEVEEVQPMHQQYWQLPEGLRVSRIPGENSQLVGLAQGDIIIRLNGQEISSRESLYAVLRTLREGQVVTAVVIRDNVEISLQLTIQSSGEYDYE